MMAQLVGNSGDNKGQLTDLVKAICRDFTRHDEAEYKKLEDWSNLYQAKKNAKDTPVCPTIAIWFPPVDTTKPAFLKNAIALEKLGGRTQYFDLPEVEMADQLCGSHKQVSKTFRNIFDKAKAGALRATVDGVTGNPIMRANAYPEMIHLIGNAGIDSLIRKLAQHGVYNDVNKRMEYDNKVLHYTTQLQNASNKIGTLFAVADGNVGVLTRVDREALRRASANFHEWDVVRLPFIDLPVGSHYYTAVGDQSSIAGAASADMTCNVKEYFGFSVDVAFIIAYNSAPETVANPIMKAEIAAPETNTPLAMPVYVTNAAEFQPSQGG